jgi:hypothetical protein
MLPIKAVLAFTAAAIVWAVAWLVLIPLLLVPPA